MAKTFRIRKKTWKNILTIGVSLLLVVGAVAGCVALFGKETSKIGPSAFKRGDIDATGAYVESSTAIYTKEMFPCQGLRIVPAFESSGTFDVYYYNVNGELLYADTERTGIYDGDYPAAVYARVVYHPDRPKDEDAKDWKIGVLEVLKYAKQLEITVSKEQSEYVSSTNLYVAGERGAFTADNVAAVVTNNTHQASTAIPITGTYDLYTVYVKYTSERITETDVAFGIGDDAVKEAKFVNDQGKVVSGFAHTFSPSNMTKDCWYSVTVEVPKDATIIRIQGPVDAEYQIYGITVK